MALPRERIYTIDDIYALPDGKRAELIDGQIYNMALPSTIHQRLVSQFTQRIGTYIRSSNGNCEVFPAPFAVFLNKDDRNYVEPDISVICDKNKLDGKRCNGAPDFIIEIVSPASRKMDYVRKTKLYQETGVREYWIVDPNKEMVTVYHEKQWDVPVCHSFAERIQAGIYQDLYLEFTEFTK